MQYTHLVERVAGEPAVFGHDELWPIHERGRCLAIMDQGVELGLNFFDTANVYGASKAKASPSRSSGAGWRRRARREKIVWRPSLCAMGMAPKSPSCRFSHRRPCDGSLRQPAPDDLLVTPSPLTRP